MDLDSKKNIIKSDFNEEYGNPVKKIDLKDNHVMNEKNIKNKMAD